MCMTNLLICTCIHLNLIAFFKAAHKHAYPPPPPPNGHGALKSFAQSTNVVIDLTVFITITVVPWVKVTKIAKTENSLKARNELYSICKYHIIFFFSKQNSILVNRKLSTM